MKQPPLTTTDARNAVRCPVCGSLPGNPCYPGKGWAGTMDAGAGVHGGRFEAAREQIAAEAERRG